MDNTKISVIVIFLLTLNLVFVAFYLVLVLKEVRKTVTKVNYILDMLQELVVGFSKPVKGFHGFLTGVAKGLDIITRFSDSEEE